MKSDHFDTNDVIAAALKRAEKWEHQTGDLGKIVAAEIRAAVESVGQRVYQLERENAELRKDAGRLDKLDAFYRAQSPQAWAQLVRSSQAVGIRDVIDECL